MKLYYFLKRHRAIINTFLLSVFSSLFFNKISDIQSNLTDIEEVITSVVQLNAVSDILIYFSAVLLVIINAFLLIYEKIINHYRIDKRFSEIMMDHTDPNLRNSIRVGNFSWGENKTVEVCDEILYGWDISDVVVDEYIDEQYGFSKDNDTANSRHGDKSYLFNSDDYEEFIKGESFQRVLAEKNNKPRFMLTGCKRNVNKSEKLLQLYLQRTEWSQCSYVWDRFKTDKELLAEYAGDITSGLRSNAHLPNSFCLHLIVETGDNKIVISRISQNKFNDKPGRWAVTLGEQIEKEDYTDGNTFSQKFVLNWVRRAFEEEYRITGEMFDRILSEKNIRLLSIDFEGDIYNFSLVCFVRVESSFEEFNSILQTRLDTSEASEIKALEYDAIPGILLGYPENKDDYHPSSYMRMMLAYMHRYGIDKLQREVIKLSKQSK